jgi:hypothetical protein
MKKSGYFSVFAQKRKVTKEKTALFNFAKSEQKPTYFFP